MGAHAVIPAAVHNTQRFNQQHTQPNSYAYAVKAGNGSRQPRKGTKGNFLVDAGSYHDLSDTSDTEPVEEAASAIRKGKSVDLTSRGTMLKEPRTSGEWDDESNDDFGLEPEIPVTWRYMSRLYLLVPIITLVWFALLILLVTYAWPPSKREREAGQQYPHPFLWKPLAIGVFASCSVQTIRVPIWVMVSWLGASTWATTFWSTSFHAIIHELLRMATLPLIIPSPTSGFHSSYYLGLGWGVAEVTWGIVQGWEQLELYKEVMKPVGAIQLSDDVEVATRVQNGDSLATEQLEPTGSRSGKAHAMLSSVSERDEEDDGEVVLLDEEEEERDEEEEELERKVEILERMRGRRDMEELLGIPFPNIPFPLHLLWRLDTLLLNLGLTLLLSAFYFNSSPIYRHTSRSPQPFTVEVSLEHTPVTIPGNQPSRWLWLALVLVALLHVAVSLVWKVVGRVGVGAVTWGGLIVALGSVFAGLGCWGGLV
ncbi:hypothetical protein IAU60_004703 [Kwoniella sp. DSM 27419]